jgi:hypothetical protein
MRLPECPTNLGRDLATRIDANNLAALYEIRRGADLTQPKSLADI